MLTIPVHSSPKTSPAPYFGSLHHFGTQCIAFHIAYYLIEVIVVLNRKGFVSALIKMPLAHFTSAAPGTIAMTEFNEIEVQADLLNIPEVIEIDVTGLEAGTTIYLGDLKLPEGTSLLGDAEDVAATVAFPETEPVEDEESAGEDAQGESEEKAAKE